MSHLPQQTETGYSLGAFAAEGLSPLENKVILMRANGLSVKQIAKLLQCSAANINQSINNLFYKLSVNNSPELIAKAFATKNLRTLFSALFFIGIFGVNPPDGTALRTGRTRTPPTVRIQRGGNNKKLWS